MIKLNKFDSKRLLDLSTKSIILALDNTEKKYRVYDPGNYLYRLLMKESLENKFSKEGCELIYSTLASWNMNSRGAKLSEFKEFHKSINDFKKEIIELDKFKLGEISQNKFNEYSVQVETLFNNLKLVGCNVNKIGKKTSEKPRLVTFSKTLHFLLPNTVMPIDRKYTLNFFTNKTDFSKSLDKQFEIFINCQKTANEFIQKNKAIIKYKNSVWNLNLPKTVDNIIIGSMIK